jgi:cytochrome c1
LTKPSGWKWVLPETENREQELARLIKFGRQGTAMAGTEWLTDEQLADLVRFIASLNQHEER